MRMSLVLENGVMMKASGRKWAKVYSSAAGGWWVGLARDMTISGRCNKLSPLGRWHLVKLSTGPPPLQTYIKLLQFALLICVNLILLYAQGITDKLCAQSLDKWWFSDAVSSNQVTFSSLYIIVSWELTISGGKNIFSEWLYTLHRPGII